jgi:hypothetical protein
MIDIAVRIVGLMIVIALVVDGNPARAHEPYFTQLEPIKLPDGKDARLLLAHGDGVITSDPIIAVIIDGDNRVIARSLPSQVMTLICHAPAQCHAYDGRRRKILEPDPGNFRADGTLRLLDNNRYDSSINYNRIEDETTNWGFRTREPSWAEWLRAELQFAISTHSVSAAAFTIPAGMLVGLTALIAVRKRKRESKSKFWIDIGLRVLAAIVFLPIAAALMFFVALLGGITELFWLGSFFAAALAVFASELAIVFRRPSTELAGSK